MEFAYHPDRPPDPETWLALDEAERIEKARAYHQLVKIKTPNPELHAAIHAVVETQVAMQEELPVKEHLDRLITEGLDRHEAIHAIGSVLLDQIYSQMGYELSGLPDERYLKALSQLTAQSWLES